MELQKLQPIILNSIMVFCQINILCALMPSFIKQRTYRTLLNLLCLVCVGAFSVYILRSNQEGLFESAVIIFLAPSLIASLFLSKYRDGRFLFCFAFADSLIVVVNAISFLLAALATGIVEGPAVIVFRAFCMIAAAAVSIVLLQKLFLRMLAEMRIHWTTMGIVALMMELVVTYINTNPTMITERPQEWMPTLMVCIVMLSVLWMFIRIIADLQRVSDERIRAQSLRNELDISRIQIEQSQRRYESLLENIDRVRTMRHDMRHYMITLEGLCEAQQWEQVHAYIRQMSERTDAPLTSAYCANYALNVLLDHFAQLCQQQQIEFIHNVSVPEELPCEPLHACVIVGNALQNALEACMEMPQADRRRYMDITLRMKADKLVLRLENSYCGELHQTDNGELQTRKQEPGHGIGLRSIRDTAAIYKGWVSADGADGVFLLQVVLGNPDAL